MPSKVYFGSTQAGKDHPSASLAVKVDKVVDLLGLSTIEKNDKVAIKMHLGFRDGYQTIPVFFIRRIVNKIKEAGGWPFITDNPTSVYNAVDRGYTSETCGCPIIPISGIKDGYVTKKEVNYRNVPEIYMAGVLEDADVLFDISHIKGHNSCGFGGQIKNLGLGGFAAKSRWEKIHGIHQSIPYWDADKCSPDHAKKLVQSCPYKAIKYNEEKHRLRLIFDNCYNTNCGECLKADEKIKCLDFRQEHFSAFSELQAIAAKQVIDSFDINKRFFISFALEITSLCDCFGIAQPVIVNDIGVLASRDMVAIETAALDLIAKEGLIEQNLPPYIKHVNLDPSLDLHVFQRIHGSMKNPYMAVDFMAEMTKGTYSKDYELIEVLSPEETSKSEVPTSLAEKAPSFF
ncbi:MAG: hypothetical protein HeimC3_17950 [Candidatus Heimdallarchaeota archaeon LC_3]|nr:MAG: hypothetical protein HeimC3_17950 [Candidatus Heimdallarchaeota archaeon LC_3]